MNDPKTKCNVSRSFGSPDVALRTYSNYYAIHVQADFLRFNELPETILL